jgi:DMSO/TMAO reductase YedYZ molybdopterin-dependent catalytic subunit
MDYLTPRLVVDGEVERALSLSFDDLSAIDAASQIVDVSRIDAKRRGDAVKFEVLVTLAQPKASVRYVTLHASADDFHASIPLSAVLERAILIYRLDGQPLSSASGGPVRFFIPDFAACNTHEVDECANVKFLDRIEFSASAGRDNRPHDAQEHAELHEREAKGR